METRKGVLYQISQISYTGEIKKIILPTQYWTQMITLTHESNVERRLGTKKMAVRNTSNFHRQGVIGGVSIFCRSCKICQRTVPRRKVAKVLLGNKSLIEEPFSRLAVDLTGPLMPVSDKGNQYVLT
ncbi:uncharacterized protein LOC143228154 [Tachypleus tridentatus]|uniref:uncharacterized protein LOC143228154 n=1 Tax=Tachypleus tridentatus TaxID=6853 RepID=UPI003FD29747